MAKLFISHASADNSFIEEELAGLLRALGFEIWYAEKDIETAEQWERMIVAGLESTKWFVVVMTARSAQSKWVKAEVAWALEKRPGRVIPLLVDDCNPRDFHFLLTQIQHIDYRADKSARSKLIALLNSEYRASTLGHIVNGLMNCPSKEILTVLRAQTGDQGEQTTIIGANDCANRFYGRKAGSSVVGMQFDKLFQDLLRLWMDENDYAALMKDQQRMREGIRRGEEIYATVPFRINQAHPMKEMRGRIFFPIVIACSYPERQQGVQVEDYLVFYLRLDEVLGHGGGDDTPGKVIS